MIKINAMGICRSRSELRNWCRETFGKNEPGQSYKWMSRGRFKTKMKANKYHFITKYQLHFYFAKQEHANWFIMRWM